MKPDVTCFEAQHLKRPGWLLVSKTNLPVNFFPRGLSTRTQHAVCLPGKAYMDFSFTVECASTQVQQIPDTLPPTWPAEAEYMLNYAEVWRVQSTDCEQNTAYAVPT
ncbi:TPA_exp: hypothetical protein A8136_0368 [Trichophyton benhamiae CBS 112371]|nr:TPA_exp: hypothetical protein A8136_0368 [Trichophyton benhamiae CBS 112371]